MVMALEAVGPQLELTAQGWWNGADYGANWVVKRVSAIQRRRGRVAGGDSALDLAGGFGIFKSTEIERLFRDARLGRIHPANAALSHELVAKTALGINRDELPRWG